MQGLGREVLEVEGDDGMGSAGDGCGQDVSVVRIGQIQPDADCFPAANAGVLEGVRHHLDSVVHARLAEVGADEQDGVLDLAEDPIAPQRPVERCFGQPQQRVAQRRGNQDAGVQDSGIHRGSGALAARVGEGGFEGLGFHVVQAGVLGVAGKFLDRLPLLAPAAVVVGRAYQPVEPGSDAGGGGSRERHDGAWWSGFSRRRQRRRVSEGDSPYALR